MDTVGGEDHNDDEASNYANIKGVLACVENLGVLICCFIIQLKVHANEDEFWEKHNKIKQINNKDYYVDFPLYKTSIIIPPEKGYQTQSQFYINCFITYFNKLSKQGQ